MTADWIQTDANLPSTPRRGLLVATMAACVVAGAAGCVSLPLMAVAMLGPAASSSPR